MADAVILNVFRRKLAKALNGDLTLPKITHMAFGDGGHDTSTHEPIEPDPAQTALNHEVLRKAAAAHWIADEYGASVRCTIEVNELVGVHLSEAAVVDENGDLVGVKNFAPKVKESDETYTITLTVRV